MILSTKSNSLFKIFVLLFFFFGYRNAYTQGEVSIPDAASAPDIPTGAVSDLENVVAYGNLDPNAVPSDNFDLSTWKLKIPSDDDENGKPDSVSEDVLSMGYQNKEYFYTGPDGGLVFKCPVAGAANSKSSKYARAELREMLRGGDTGIRTQGVNKNNWVLSSAPRKDIKTAGGVDGELTVTLAINHVTTTGSRKHIGRVVIGQIHANSDEPVRIYYRKLKHNELGSIYFAHEINHGDDGYYEMIGRRADTGSNPIGGIALNEKFTFKIKVKGNKMWVTIIREGKEDLVQFVDMRKSGYDEGGQFLYFKTGLYNANNSGDADDYVQATFYKIEKTH